jgi:hypothetical protein
MKNIKWLLQSSGFTTSYTEELAESLTDLNLNWDDFGIVEDTITNLENILHTSNDTYIVRGGTKLLRMLQETKSIKELNPFLTEEQLKNNKIHLNSLKKSLDYNEKRFDMEYYSTLGLPLLNSDIEMYTVYNLLYSEFEKDMFVKPSKDSKAFNGGIIHSGETLMNYLMRTPHRPIDEIGGDTVIIAALRNIKEEYRFFMYKDTVLGSSRYMLYNKVNPCKNVPQELKDKAKEYGKLYNPSDIYVMDLCTFSNSDEVKIVEYNCWNCSGFYHSDIKSIIKQIDIIKSNTNYTKD